MGTRERSSTDVSLRLESRGHILDHHGSGSVSYDDFATSRILDRVLRVCFFVPALRELERNPHLCLFVVRANCSFTRLCGRMFFTLNERLQEMSKPAHEIRLGAIKVAIWANETDRGKRYSVSPARLYKDGDDWKSTQTFGRDDLLVLAKVLDMAHTWIHENQS